VNFSSNHSTRRSQHNERDGCAIEKRHDLIPNPVEAFPSNFVSNGFGFSAADFFAAAASERVTPNVGAEWMGRRNWSKN